MKIVILAAHSERRMCVGFEGVASFLTNCFVVMFESLSLRQQQSLRKHVQRSLALNWIYTYKETIINPALVFDFVSSASSLRIPLVTSEHISITLYPEFWNINTALLQNGRGTARISRLVLYSSQREEMLMLREACWVVMCPHRSWGRYWQASQKGERGGGAQFSAADLVDLLETDLMSCSFFCMQSLI